MVALDGPQLAKEHFLQQAGGEQGDEEEGVCKHQQAEVRLAQPDKGRVEVGPRAQGNQQRGPGQRRRRCCIRRKPHQSISQARIQLTTTTTTMKSVFAVPLECGSCVEDVGALLRGAAGVERFDVDLRAQRVTVEGPIAPSSVHKLLKASGRDCILRGTGDPDTAAVCILETCAPTTTESPVRGLARLVETSKGLTMVDLNIKGRPRSIYEATVRQAGDVSRGAASAGGVLGVGGRLGRFETDREGVGEVIMERNLSVPELIGRGMLVELQEPNVAAGDQLLGVIARSAGAWENAKTVCSCSGKTVWEERKEQVARGMM